MEAQKSSLSPQNSNNNQLKTLKNLFSQLLDLAHGANVLHSKANRGTETDFRADDTSESNPDLEKTAQDLNASAYESVPPDAQYWLSNGTENRLGTSSAMGGYGYGSNLTNVTDASIGGNNNSSNGAGANSGVNGAVGGYGHVAQYWPLNGTKNNSGTSSAMGGYGFGSNGTNVAESSSRGYNYPSNRNSANSGVSGGMGDYRYEESLWVSVGNIDVDAETSTGGYNNSSNGASTNSGVNGTGVNSGVNRAVVGYGYVPPDAQYWPSSGTENRLGTSSAMGGYDYGSNGKNMAETSTGGYNNSLNGAGANSVVNGAVGGYGYLPPYAQYWPSNGTKNNLGTRNPNGGYGNGSKGTNMAESCARGYNYPSNGASADLGVNGAIGGYGCLSPNGTKNNLATNSSTCVMGVNLPFLTRCV